MVDNAKILNVEYLGDRIVFRGTWNRLQHPFGRMEFPSNFSSTINLVHGRLSLSVKFYLAEREGQLVIRREGRQ